MAVVGLEGLVQLWQVSDWSRLAELPVGTRAVNGMAFSPDGQWLAVGAADGKIRIWDLQQLPVQG
jgi:WD40 repeat protein